MFLFGYAPYLWGQTEINLFIDDGPVWLARANLQHYYSLGCLRSCVRTMRDMTVNFIPHVSLWHQETLSRHRSSLVAGLLGYAAKFRVLGPGWHSPPQELLGGVRCADALLVNGDSKQNTEIG